MIGSGFSIVGIAGTLKDNAISFAKTLGASLRAYVSP
jgi:hypothetical protein